MAFARLAPLIFIAAMIGLAFAGSKVRTYPVDPASFCSFEFTQLDEPASDILVFGTSRAGRGIDAAYVQTLLRAKTGGDVSVQRLSLANPDIPSFDVFYREYLRQRGAPKLVVLQVLYNREPERQALIGAPLHNVRNVLLGDLGDLHAVQKEAEAETSGERLRRGYRPITAVAIDKFTNNIYAALRYPYFSSLGMDPNTICVDDLPLRQSGNWLHGDLPGEPTVEDPRDHGSPEDWAAEVAGYLPLDPAGVDRALEVGQMRRLIQLIRSNGSEVALVLFPIFGETISQGDLASIRSLYPDLDVIDLDTPFHSAVEANEAAHFVDANHVNAKGALVLSTELASQLEGRLP
ncbi:hypothetical protein [Altererythrobacter sp. MF3-039]|uniref:hypothetical protein n=1 Tax=Altererythrobacter sp. MF3-039 TaxID=3252901 RepID=UPI00390CB824